MPRRYPGYVGEEVVLPLDRKILPGTIVSVTWKKTGQVILAFQDGEVLLASSESSYHGRTEFAGNPDEDEDEDEDGHFSLRLKNVQTEDEGEYICEVHTSERSENYSVVLLVSKCPGYALTFLQ